MLQFRARQSVIGIFQDRSIRKYEQEGKNTAQINTSACA